MAKPLRSEVRNPPNRQFAHFGVLDTGGQNKSAFFGSIVFNVVLALLAIIIGASVKKTIDTRKKMEVSFAEIKPVPKPEPPKPKIIPPKVEPPKIEPPKIEPPKIKLPDVKVVEPPKPVPVPIAQPKVVPVIMPAAPKVQAAAAAPKIQAVNMPAQSAALRNNSAAPPAPVALGRQDSPVPTNLTGPAVSNVRLNNGMSGMPPGAGVGRPSAVSLAGNGSSGGRIGGTAGRRGCRRRPGMRRLHRQAKWQRNRHTARAGRAGAGSSAASGCRPHCFDCRGQTTPGALQAEAGVYGGGDRGARRGIHHRSHQGLGQWRGHGPERRQQPWPRPR